MSTINVVSTPIIKKSCSVKINVGDISFTVKADTRDEAINIAKTLVSGAYYDELKITSVIFDEEM